MVPTYLDNSRISTTRSAVETLKVYLSSSSLVVVVVDHGETTIKLFVDEEKRTIE